MRIKSALPHEMYVLVVEMGSFANKNGKKNNVEWACDLPGICRKSQFCISWPLVFFKGMVFDGFVFPLDNSMDPLWCPEKAHGILFVLLCFFFFVGECASLCKEMQPATRTAMCHRCGTKNQYNHTQHHYHTHDVNILTLKHAGHSLKRIVRDGVNRILSLSLRVCMSHGARLKTCCM